MASVTCVADHHVVRHVGADHEERIGADAGHAQVFGGAAMDGDVLAKGIAIADLERRRLPGVRSILRLASQDGVGEHHVVFPMRVGPEITHDATRRVPRPSTTSSPTMQKGPTVTPSPSVAPALTRAVGWMSVFTPRYLP